MLMNTGPTPFTSTCGLLTTLAYKFGEQKQVYALEGSIAVTGALVQWLRDNLSLFASSPEIEALAAGVPDNGGVVIVPAFSGLYAPYWNEAARGLDRRPDALCRQAPYRPRRARGDGLPDPRRARGHGQGHRHRRARAAQSTAAWSQTRC